MWSIFKRKPAFQDKAFEELAALLTENGSDSVVRRELLDPARLDYSIDSLKHIDEFLDALHLDPPTGEGLFRVVLRCGAYVGEVIRRHSATELHWIDHEAAAREVSFLMEQGPSIGTAAILWASPAQMCFPLAKVGKHIESGEGESVYFFAQVISANWRGESPGALE